MIEEESTTPEMPTNSVHTINESSGPDNQDENHIDIFIQKSSLVSRQHLILQLKDQITGLQADQQKQQQHVTSKKVFWQMQSISKNGIFLNNHYIEKGKSIKLFLNKRYTMRFPNTNTKIIFETNRLPERSQNESQSTVSESSSSNRIIQTLEASLEPAPSRDV